MNFYKHIPNVREDKVNNLNKVATGYVTGTIINTSSKTIN